MRVAAVAAAGFFLVACGSASSTAAISPAASQGTAVSPSATSSGQASPLTSPTASPTAAASPSAPASAGPTACQELQGGTSARAVITDVRVGSHPGYDRVVVEFSGGLPAYKLSPQDPSTFVGPASGRSIPVAGSSGFHLYIYQMDIPPTYANGNLTPAYSVLKQVVVMGVFEGQADIAIGVGSTVCPAVSTMSGPYRLVIDFPTQ